MNSSIAMDILTEQGTVPITVLSINGEIDASTSDQLLNQAKSLVSEGTRNLLLDLSQVAYISSAGLRSLHQIYTLLRQTAFEESDEVVKKGLLSGTYRSPHLKLLNPTSSVEKSLSYSGLDMFLDIFHDRTEAIAAFTHTHE
jgi:anti-sigma B factor antagonist